MITTIQRWGNTQCIQLPKMLLDALNMHEGAEVEILTEDNSIVIKPVKRRKTIQELFAGYEGDYKPQEIDWGKPEGNEIW